MAKLSASGSRGKNNRIINSLDGANVVGPSDDLSLPYESFEKEINSAAVLQEKVQAQSQRYSQLKIGVKKELYKLEKLHKIKVDLSEMDQYVDVLRKKKSEIENVFSRKKVILVKDYDELKLQLESEVNVIKKEKDKIEFELGDIRRNIEFDQIESLKKIEDRRVLIENEIEKKRDDVQKDLKAKAQAFKDHVSEVRDTLSIQKRGLESELEVLSAEFSEKKNQIESGYLEFKKKYQEDMGILNVESDLKKEELNAEIEKRKRLHASKLSSLEIDLKTRRNESERLYSLFEKSLREKEEVLHRQFQEKERNLYERLETRKIKLTQEEKEFVKKIEDNILKNENNRVFEEQKFENDKKLLLDQLDAFKLTIDGKCKVYEKKEMELSKLKVNESKDKLIFELTTQSRLKIEKMEDEYRATYQSNLSDLASKSRKLTEKYNEKCKNLNDHEHAIQEKFVRKIGVFEREISSIRTDYDNAVEKAEASFIKRESEVELLFDNKLDKLKSGLESQGKRLSIIHDSKVSELNTQISKNNDAFNAKVEELESEYQRKTDAFEVLQAKSEEDTTRRRFTLEKKINTQQASLEKEFKELKDVLEAKVLKRESDLGFLFCQLGSQFDEKSLELDNRYLEKVQASEKALFYKNEVNKKKYNELKHKLEKRTSLRDQELEEKYQQMFSGLESEYLEKMNELTLNHKAKFSRLDTTFSNRESDLDDLYKKKYTVLDKKFEDKNKRLEEKFVEKKTSLSDSYNVKAISLERSFEEQEKELNREFDSKSKDLVKDLSQKTSELESTFKDRSLFLEKKFEKKNEALRARELKIEDEKAVVNKEKSDLRASLLRDNEQRIQDDVERLIKLEKNRHINLRDKLNSEIDELKNRLENSAAKESSELLSKKSETGDVSNQELEQLKKEFDALSKSNKKLKAAFLDIDANNAELNSRLKVSNSSVLALESQISSSFGSGDLKAELEVKLKKADSKVSELTLVNTEMVQRLNKAIEMSNSDKKRADNLDGLVKNLSNQLQEKSRNAHNEHLGNDKKVVSAQNKKAIKVLRSRSR
ncbi:hypothetical protein HOG98_10345 [bacterium]|jgi:hypothetical protein|nr:hypothetical protein [bacterium]